MVKWTKGVTPKSKGSISAPAVTMSIAYDFADFCRCCFCYTCIIQQAYNEQYECILCGKETLHPQVTAFSRDECDGCRGLMDDCVVVAELFKCCFCGHRDVLANMCYQPGVDKWCCNLNVLRCNRGLATKPSFTR